MACWGNFRAWSTRCAAPPKCSARAWRKVPPHRRARKARLPLHQGGKVPGCEVWWKRWAACQRHRLHRLHKPRIACGSAAFGGAPRAEPSGRAPQIFRNRHGCNRTGKARRWVRYVDLWCPEPSPYLRPMSRARRRPAAGRGARATAFRGHAGDRARGAPRPQPWPRP
jgi:hypothetical protein